MCDVIYTLLPSSCLITTEAAYFLVINELEPQSAYVNERRFTTAEKNRSTSWVFLIL